MCPIKISAGKYVQKITEAHIDLPPSPPPLLPLSNVTEEGSMNNVKVSTTLVSPGTTSMTSLQNYAHHNQLLSLYLLHLHAPTWQTVPMSLRKHQSKYDGIHPKLKHSVKSIKRINSDTKTQGTIIAAFDKCKRKLSPNKEADTERDNLKVSHGDTSPI